MRALLLIGGDPPPRNRVLSDHPRFDFICAADSGLLIAAAWGLEPDAIVGDMDSLPDRALLSRYPAARILELPRAKDESDTEAGLRLCRAQGASEIIIAGGGGGRL